MTRNFRSLEIYRAGQTPSHHEDHRPRCSRDLLGSVVNRKEFYHQSLVSRSKAFWERHRSRFPPACFRRPRAHDDFVAWVKSRNSKPRRGGEYLVLLFRGDDVAGPKGKGHLLVSRDGPW